MELRESTERAFEDYGESLENLTAFKYLGQVLAVVDDDWPSVVGNLCKARKSLGGGCSGYWASRSRIRRCRYIF